MDVEFSVLTQNEEHAGRKPGSYAVLVMPMYCGSLVGLTQVYEFLLAEQGARLEKAVQYIHSLGLVHMDIKVGNGVEPGSSFSDSPATAVHFLVPFKFLASKCWFPPHALTTCIACCAFVVFQS